MPYGDTKPAVGAALNAHDLATNLTGLWGLLEDTGTSAADSSGSGNTGTLTGSPAPSWAAGLTGCAVGLVKANAQRIEIAANAAFQPGYEDFSVAWICKAATSANDRLFIDQRNVNSPYTGWAIGRSGASDQVGIEMSGAGRVVIGGTCTTDVMPVDTWLRMVLTVDRDGSWRLYQNGAEIGNGDASSAATSNVVGTNYLKLGGHHADNTGYSFDGLFEGAWFWKGRILTPDNVTTWTATPWVMLGEETSSSSSSSMSSSSSRTPASVDFDLDYLRVRPLFYGERAPVALWSSSSSSSSSSSRSSSSSSRSSSSSSSSSSV